MESYEANQIRRKNDEKQANEVHKLLEEYFYKKFTTNYKDITDIHNQIKGVDTIFTYNGFDYVCDEKAAIRHREIDTFIQEAAFINRAGEISEGWSVKDGLKTNSYILVWVEEDKIEFVLIKKSKVKEHLLNIGLTKEYIQSVVDRMLKHEWVYLGDIERDGYKFVRSDNLLEKPINVKLAKSFYIENSDFHDIILTTQFKGRAKEGCQ